MKRFVKVICIILAAVMLFCITAFAGSSYGYDDGELNKFSEKWPSVVSNDEVMALTVGRNERELNFSWLSSFGDKNPKIKISEKQNMKDSTELDVKSSLTLLGKWSNHAAATGLAAGKTYYYAYTVNCIWSEPYSFTVRDSDEFSAIFVSDAQIGRSGDADNEEVLIRDTCGWNDTVNKALNTAPDAAFILSAGDQVEWGYSDLQYKAFLYPEQLRSVPVAAAIGNHDFYFPLYSNRLHNPNPVKELLASPAGNGYYFTYADALFIVLNSNDMFMPDQKALIQKAVNACPDKAYRVVMMHHSAYSASYAEHEFALPRMVFAPLFDAYDIDLVLSGHDHMYARSCPMKAGRQAEDGTVYVQASSASGSNFDSVPDETASFVEYAFREKIPTYTTLRFDSESITVETYRTDTDAKIDTVSVAKDKENKAEQPSLAALLSGLFSTVYAMLRG